MFSADSSHIRDIVGHTMVLDEVDRPTSVLDRIVAGEYETVDEIIDDIPCMNEVGDVAPHHIISATEGDEGTPLYRDGSGHAWVPFGTATVLASDHQAIERMGDNAFAYAVDLQARVGALETALEILVSNYDAATNEIDRTGDRAALDAVNWQAQVILTNLGLAHRLEGNLSKAEQVTA